MQFIKKILGGLADFIGLLLAPAQTETEYARRLIFGRETGEVWNPAKSALRALFWGAVLGYLSLIQFPRHYLHTSSMQLADLIITPLIISLMMQYIWYRVIRRVPKALSFWRWLYNYSFLLGIALFRFTFAK